MNGEACRLRAFLSIENIGEDIHEKLLRVLVEDAPIGAFIISLGKGEGEGRIIYANPGFCHIFGYTENECKAMPEAWNFIHPDDRKSLDETFKELPAGGKGHCEVRGLKKDGTVMHTSIIGSVNTFEGMPSIVGTVIDITARTVLEKDKEDFFAMVTHDLKGPLTTIIGYLELILARKDRDDKRLWNMLENVEESAQRLNRLVENFLMVHKLETGNLKISPKPENITLILKELGREFYPVAKQRGIMFSTDIPILPPAVVDRINIERAVSNLLQNAFKYTPSGGKIMLKAEMGSRDIIISVEDTGPGIPKEDMGRIFDKYYRAFETESITGVGLGLVIVEAVAKAHGGKVSVESEPGKGSTFKIHLPLTA
ncbi:MAG: PAS domain-containing sensor histidine kinase [Nitrospirota bacterium]